MGVRVAIVTDSSAYLPAEHLERHQIMHIVDGQVAPLEKVRTASRALARLEDLAVWHAADRVVDLAVQHMAAGSRAAALAARLRDRVPKVRDMYVGEVGPVIGAHVGPGMLGVVIAPP
jgi:fatty acid-binding protein DegV